MDASFKLPGGISALFGPSGSGKSTCLALIAGLLKPAAGTIRLGKSVLVDRETRRWTPPHRRHLGTVFQDHLLFPHKTVRANLRYGMARSLSRVQASEEISGKTSRGPGAGGDAEGDRVIRLHEVVEVLGLGGLLDRYPAQLSGGQQRRVALGRALLTQPRLLMMDEPLIGLDEVLRDRILEHLQQVHEYWKMPMLLVSHDQLVVRRLAGYVVVLEQGCVIDQGAVGQTLDRATLQTMASHPGPINLLRIEQVQQVGDHSEGRIGNQPFYLPHRPAAGTVYVRCLPGDVALTLEAVPRISMRNHLRGTVRDMVQVSDDAQGKRIYVAIDVGQTIWAELTCSACRELDLHIGSPVVCLLKATALAQVA